MPSDALVEPVSKQPVRGGRGDISPLRDLQYGSIKRKQAEAWVSAVYLELGSADLTDRERDTVERAAVDYAFHRDLQHRYDKGAAIDPADILAAGNTFRRSEAKVEALKRRLLRGRR
jgi:hypothetical protein